MSAEEIVVKSKESYGKQMCMDCVFEASSEIEESAEEVEENDLEIPFEDAEE